jgi:hypothetical protein
MDGGWSATSNTPAPAGSANRYLAKTGVAARHASQIETPAATAATRIGMTTLTRDAVMARSSAGGAASVKMRMTVSEPPSMSSERPGPGRGRGHGRWRQVSSGSEDQRRRRYPVRYKAAPPRMPTVNVSAVQGRPATSAAIWSTTEAMTIRIPNAPRT